MCKEVHLLALQNVAAWFISHSLTDIKAFTATDWRQAMFSSPCHAWAPFANCNIA